MTNQPFLFHKTVVLRSPLSPIKHAFSEQEIKEKIQTELIQEALFLSSPSLYRQIRPYLEGKLNNRDSERFLISIYKYLTRCANRCTPFGLFAGLGTIKWGDKTKITVENNAIRRFTKLDMDFICSLVEHIEEHLKEHLTFSLNSSINLQEGYFTYIEYSYSNNKRAHSVSSVELTDIISKVLQLATPGINYEELISRLSLEYKNTVSKTEINDFITSLINNQILKSDLQPRVSGDNFYEYIIARLDCIGSKTEGTNNYLELLKGRLKTIKTYLGELDSNPSLHIPSIYSKIFQNLDQLEIEYDEKKIFHVDCNHLYAPSSTLSTDLKDNIIDCLHVLNKLSRPNHNANLDQFIDAFDEKYGRRSVKLLDCLDTERGIGYPIQNSSLPPTFIADILPNANGHSRSFANREVLLIHSRLYHLVNGLFLLEFHLEPNHYSQIQKCFLINHGY
ncbi:MAG: lantibiotic dehydratase [Bacteroidota bacterium]